MEKHGTRTYALIGMDKSGKFFGETIGKNGSDFSEERVRVYGPGWISEAYGFKALTGLSRENHEYFVKHKVPGWDMSVVKLHTNPNSLKQFLWFYLRQRAIMHNQNTKRTGITWKAYRVGSAHCPVDIDLTARIGMKRKKIEYSEYDYRNCPFKAK